MKEFRVGYTPRFSLLRSTYITSIVVVCALSLVFVCVFKYTEVYIRLSLLFSILNYYMLKLAGVGSLLLTGRAFPI